MASVIVPDDAKCSLAEAGCLFDDRFEDRRKIAWRRIDCPLDFCCGLLLSNRFAKLAPQFSFFTYKFACVHTLSSTASFIPDNRFTMSPVRVNTQFSSRNRLEMKSGAKLSSTALSCLARR